MWNLWAPFELAAPFDMAEGEEYCCVEYVRCCCALCWSGGAVWAWVLLKAWCFWSVGAFVEAWVLLLKRGCFCWSVAAVWAEPIVHADWCTLWHGRGWSAGTLWCVMLGAFVEAWVLLLKRGCCWCKCCYYVLCWYFSRCRCEAVATMVLCWYFSRCRCVKRGCCWSVVLLEIGLPDW